MERDWKKHVDYDGFTFRLQILNVIGIVRIPWGLLNTKPTHHRSVFVQFKSIGIIKSIA